MGIDREDMGGDPACWLNRVCENCGRFVDDEFATTCPNCGAPRYDDPVSVVITPTRATAVKDDR